MTREEALEKAALHITEAEKTMGEVNLGKHLSLTQLCLSYAHEVSLTPSKTEPNG
jgi:hypothetical protein